MISVSCARIIIDSACIRINVYWFMFIHMYLDIYIFVVFVSLVCSIHILQTCHHQTDSHMLGYVSAGNRQNGGSFDIYRFWALLEKHEAQ